MALLYQDLRVQSMKLRFYLLPNDSSLKKAVHELELTYSSQRVRKPPDIKKALMTGSCFSLQKMTDVTICPEDLKFKYLDADMEQQYLELHAKDMKDELNIFLIEKDTNEIVWIAVIRKGEFWPRVESITRWDLRFRKLRHSNSLSFPIFFQRT
nr:NACHT, LRR and PYD domains-containing protein 1a allele 5-like [Anolis sagrei ordinatus]